MTSTHNISHLKIVTPKTKPEKTTQSTVDTIMLTPAVITQWKSPDWQRPLRVTPKVLSIVELIKRDGGVVPGIITLGVFEGDIYIVDGQHRLHAFVLTELLEGYADVRTMHFSSMADMSDEYVNLNSRLVSLRPDDMLRGLEPSLPVLRRIRKECSFVGYDMIRRKPTAPLLSMSSVVRVWAAATMEVPMAGGDSVATRAKALSEDEAEKLCRFLNICFKAWGRDPEFARLWGSLNLSVTGWLYRRIVLGDNVSTIKRHVRLSGDEYGKALMALSANSHYQDWLVNRRFDERNRVPCFNRIKQLIGQRLASNGRKVLMPMPAWASGR